MNAKAENPQRDAHELESLLQTLQLCDFEQIDPCHMQAVLSICAQKAVRLRIAIEATSKLPEGV